MTEGFSTSFLSDALVILGAAGLIIPVFARFRITPVIGFILVGVAVGPFGLGKLVPDYPWLANFTISDMHRLEPYAEFGIILLLFSIGLELSFNRLWDMRRLVFGLGALEMLAIATLLTLALKLSGQDWAGALGLGLALALSSTALVMQIAGNKGPVGQAALSMLLFEDIMIVPIIFLLGAMAPHAAEGVGNLWSTLGWGLVAVVGLLVLGRLALPRLFAQAARTKSPELFLAASLLVVIGASLVTEATGLSPIVGALIAGLLIAETEYHGEVEHIIEPFKGLALGVFLLTVGMGIDLLAIWDGLALIVPAVVGVLLVKALVTGFMLRLMGARRGTAAETGILMASPSETTLIVLAAASQALLIDAETAQFWQIVTAIGLTVTPLLAKLGKVIARRVDSVRPPTEAEGEDATGRVIVIGFGRVGRLVGDMLKVHGKRYIGIDGDTDIVEAAKSQGYAVTFGNAAGAKTLERLDLENALAVVLTMDEPVLAQRLVRKIRAARPDLKIIVRARDMDHAAALYRSGASLAVPETLESSLQLSEAVLVDLGVAMGPVIASIHAKRDEFRAQLRLDAKLDHTPKLRTTTAER